MFMISPIPWIFAGAYAAGIIRLLSPALEKASRLYETEWNPG